VVAQNDLIIDLGMHLGEDTDFYLKKGFRVIAVEANPVLVARCRARFADAIGEGRLIILSGAIGPESPGKEISFFVNKLSIWGTINSSWALRNERLGMSSSVITVPRLNLEEVFSYGMPYYLKMDIEGGEGQVLEFFLKANDRPQYISLESEKVNFSDLILEMNLLAGLGYKKFKVVQQATIPRSKLATKSLDGSIFEHVFEPHSSGGFGDEAKGPWLNYDDALKLYRSIFADYKLFGDNAILPAFNPWTYPNPGWYDTHATF
jgi:FkbM family methyltransferase